MYLNAHSHECSEVLETTLGFFVVLWMVSK
jgi:hypothetical protein